jgi:adenylate cyclase
MTEDVWERLAAKLPELGVDEHALKAASAEGLDGIRRLIARYVSFPGARRYTAPEVYTKAGVDEDRARALWRAMGFPTVPDDEAAFTDADIEAVRLASDLFDRAQMDGPIVHQQTRSMGQAAARIAAAHLDVISEVIPQGGTPDAAERAMTLAEEILPSLDRLLVYMYRRHLAAATEQRLLVTLGEEGGVTMSAGFADLSGFTALSQELDVRELAALIDGFNAATADVVSQAGGRVIKTIGDEVMFGALDPASAGTIAVALLDQVSEREGMPALKVGVATGTVIAREGDLFGGPVNLASRLVTTARPGSILVDEATRESLSEDPRFEFSALAERHLKGFGRVASYRLRPAGSREPEAKPSRHRDRERRRRQHPR